MQVGSNIEVKPKGGGGKKGNKFVSSSMRVLHFDFQICA